MVFSKYKIKKQKNDIFVPPCGCGDGNITGIRITKTGGGRRRKDTRNNLVGNIILKKTNQ